MNYFIKLLPVEGEIKDGDYFLWKIGDITQGYKYIEDDGGNWKKNMGDRFQKLQKLKYFLCSRDIQVGDKVYGTILNGDIWIADKVEDMNHISLEEAQIMDGYKIIGEISPRAVGLGLVKEGDIEEERLLMMKTEVAIQCPCCKTWK